VCQVGAAPNALAVGGTPERLFAAPGLENVALEMDASVRGGRTNRVERKPSVAKGLALRLIRPYASRALQRAVPRRSPVGACQPEDEQGDEKANGTTGRHALARAPGIRAHKRSACGGPRANQPRGT